LDKAGNGSKGWAYASHLKDRIMAIGKEFILTIFCSRFIQIVLVEVFVPPAICTLIWKNMATFGNN